MPLLNIPVQSVSVGAQYHMNQQQWVNDYLNLPVVDNESILLVPKAIVRFTPAYNHQTYYNHFALNYLQAEHLSAGSSLVQSLKNGKQIVTKKDLKAHYPCTKKYLYDFSRQHPDVLDEYKEFLKINEKEGRVSDIQVEDEPIIARALSTALTNIPSGPDSATEYHRIMIGILEFIFFPSLLSPQKEREIHNGRKRIDIIMENGAFTGIFKRLHSIHDIPCAFIAIECKNYSREIANPELDQISGRFSTNRGKVGIICCRRFEDREWFVNRCQDTFKDARGLILAVDDNIIESWLKMIEMDQRELIEGNVSTLINDVRLN